MRKVFLYIFFVCILGMATNAYSQPRSAYIGFSFLYDWQMDKGGIGDFRKASSVGMSVLLDCQITSSLAYRLYAIVPGFFSGDGYDRRGLAGFDIKYNLINAINGYSSPGNIYPLFGAGIAMGVNGSDVLSAFLRGGIGYNQQITRHLNVFGEYTVTFCQGFSSTGGVGLMIRL